jgi:hypothetical protein
MVIYSDNFNAPDTANFDSASLVGRTSGLDAANVLPQSGGSEQAISSGQLNLTLNNESIQSEMRFDTIGSSGGFHEKAVKWKFGCT